MQTMPPVFVAAVPLVERPQADLAIQGVTQTGSSSANGEADNPDARDPALASDRAREIARLFSGAPPEEEQLIPGFPRSTRAKWAIGTSSTPTGRLCAAQSRSPRATRQRRCRHCLTRSTQPRPKGLRRSKRRSSRTSRACRRRRSAMASRRTQEARSRRRRRPRPNPRLPAPLLRMCRNRLRRARWISADRQWAPRQGHAAGQVQGGRAYSAKAASVMALVQAPSGSAVITGSDPPASSVATVRA